MATLLGSSILENYKNKAGNFPLKLRDPTLINLQGYPTCSPKREPQCQERHRVKTFGVCLVKKRRTGLCYCLQSCATSACSWVTSQSARWELGTSQHCPGSRSQLWSLVERSRWAQQKPELGHMDLRSPLPLKSLLTSLGPGSPPAEGRGRFQ